MSASSARANPCPGSDCLIHHLTHSIQNFAVPSGIFRVLRRLAGCCRGLQLTVRFRALLLTSDFLLISRAASVREFAPSLLRQSRATSRALTCSSVLPDLPTGGAASPTAPTPEPADISNKANAAILSGRIYCRVCCPAVYALAPLFYALVYRITSGVLQTPDDNDVTR